MKAKKNLRSLLSILLCCVMLLGVCSTVTFADSGDVAINATNFPDANFRTYVETNCDTDGNGVLSVSEIAAVESVDVTGKGIASLEGIETFVNIHQLICDNNNLTAIDVSALNKLSDFSLKNNQISTLNLTGNPELGILRCEDNNLTSLNVTNNTKLWLLSIGGNNISSIDLRHNPYLERFASVGNPIASFDFSGCPLIGEIVISSKSMTSLDVRNLTHLGGLNLAFSSNLTELKLGNNPNLYEFIANYTKLASLDLSDHTLLHRVSVIQAELTSIDVSGCTALKELTVSGNDLTAMNLSGCTALEELDCGYNEFTSLDLSEQTQLTDLYVGHNHLVDLDLTANTLLTSSSVSGGYQTIYVPMGPDRSVDLKEINPNYKASRVGFVNYGTRNGSILTLHDGAEEMSYYYDVVPESLDYQLCVYVHPLYLPGVPTNVTAVAGDKEATISFTAPEAVEGAEITGYVVTSEPGGITATGTSSPITVTGLQNGVPYTFTVTALSGKQASEASEPSNSVTPMLDVDIVDTSVVPPKAGQVPYNAYDDGYGWVRYAGIVWTPLDNPFKGGTEYTATITISADKNMDVYTSRFTGETEWYVNGTPVVPVSMTEKEAVLEYTFPATKQLTSIAVTNAPTNTEYAPGDDFNPAGMVVTAYYEGGTSGPVRDYTITDGKTLGASQTTVTISYTEGGITKTTTQAIQVKSSESPEIVFTDSDKFDIPQSEVGIPIDNIDVSSGVSGGTKPFNFNASGLPEGIEISSDGVISGTPKVKTPAGTATIYVIDAAGRSKSITINYGEIKEHTHTYGNWTYADDKNHEKECVSCGDKVTEEHDFIWVTDKEATETETGLKHEECKICGYKKAAVEIPATGYLVTFDGNGGMPGYTSARTDKDGKLASLPTATRKGYTFNGWFDAKTGGTEITTATVFTANTLVYARWTEGHTHAYGDWKSDADNHWHECKDEACPNKSESVKDKAAHSFTWVIDKDATETEAGSKHEECEICGYKKAAVEIPATGGDSEKHECSCIFCAILRWIKAFVKSCIIWLENTPVSIGKWFAGVFNNIIALVK